MRKTTVYNELKSRVYSLLFIGLLSRFVVWSLGVVAALSVDAYDSSGKIAYRLLQNESSTNLLDTLLKHLIAPFANWDGIYFLRISEYGYEYEQFHAFFPLYPLCIRAITNSQFNACV
jgi:phosphatidylinositol glycan class V